MPCGVPTPVAALRLPRKRQLDSSRAAFRTDQQAARHQRHQVEGVISACDSCFKGTLVIQGLCFGCGDPLLWTFKAFRTIIAVVPIIHPFSYKSRYKSRIGAI